MIDPVMSDARTRMDKAVEALRSDLVDHPDRPRLSGAH